MKYLKMIVTSPWIVLLIILTINSVFRIFDSFFHFESFVFGFLIIFLTYCLIDKIKQSIHKDQLKKLDKMSRASAVVYYDDNGKEIVEENEEYTRGFREAASIIIKDLK